jgi:hypothetical protein
MYPAKKVIGQFFISQMFLKFPLKISAPICWRGKGLCIFSGKNAQSKNGFGGR